MSSSPIIIFEFQQPTDHRGHASPGGSVDTRAWRKRSIWRKAQLMGCYMSFKPSRIRTAQGSTKDDSKTRPKGGQFLATPWSMLCRNVWPSSRSGLASPDSLGVPRSVLVPVSRCMMLSDQRIRLFRKPDILRPLASIPSTCRFRSFARFCVLVRD